MKTEYQINMDFQKAEAQVAELKQLASQLSAVADEDLNRTLGNIAASWEGENAEAFIEKGNLLKQKITKTAGELLSAAGALHSIAENIKNAELDAIRIAAEKGTTVPPGGFGSGLGGGGFR